MKCAILIVALCFFGACAGQGLSTDFLVDNLLQPLLDQIRENSLNLLQSQLSQLLGGLFGKRSAESAKSNIVGALNSYTAQVKNVYKNFLKSYVQILQSGEFSGVRSNLGRVKFIQLAADAEKELAELPVKSDLLQPFVTSTQKAFSDFIEKLEVALGDVLVRGVRPVEALRGLGL